MICYLNINQISLTKIYSFEFVKEISILNKDYLKYITQIGYISLQKFMENIKSKSCFKKDTNHTTLLYFK